MQKTNNLVQMQLHTGKVSALLNPVTYVVVNIGVVVLIYMASGRVNDGHILQGDVVALVNYMGQILVELIKLANLIVILMKAFPSADRVREIMSMKSDERCQDKLPINSTAIDGANTFDATSGVVEIDGQDVRNLTDSHLAYTFGIVPQRASLFSGTIRSNMTMKDVEPSDDEIKTALNIAQALDFVEEKGGLEAEVTAKGSNFSGGQRQRLTIARALIGKPRVLVLDDSSSALDLATEARLKKALEALPWKPTMIIVSQRASSLLSADQIMVLEDGRCVGLGTHKQLLESCPTYAEIYYCQYPREEALGE